MIAPRLILVLFALLALAPMPQAASQARFSNERHLGAGLARLDPARVCPDLLAQSSASLDGSAVLAHDPLAVDAYGRMVPGPDLEPGRAGARAGIVLDAWEVDALCAPRRRPPPR